MLDWRVRKLLKPINLLVCMSILMGLITACVPPPRRRYVAPTPETRAAQDAGSQVGQEPAPRSAPTPPPPAPVVVPGAGGVEPVSYDVPLPPRPPGMASYRAHAPAAYHVEVSDPVGASISMESGWHLVSLPEEPVDTNPAAVLASIAGSYTRVYAYDGCDLADPWKLYDPADPEESDLTAIDHRMGLWIEMTQTDTLDISWTRPESTLVRLCRGWNLIGYPVGLALPVPGALLSIDGKYDRVFGWDAMDVADPWAYYGVDVPNWANDLQMLEPGRGYWVHATQDANLIVTPPTTPPEMEIPGCIASPEVRARVSERVPIVLQEGPVLRSVMVDYWPVNDLNAVQVLSTAVQAAGGSTVATLDTTVLANGSYAIRVSGTDEDGARVACGTMVTVEGEYKPGRVRFTVTDLTVPVAGLPIQVGRTYDSLERHEQGDFGYGWSLAIGNPKLEVDPDHNVTVTMPNGKRVTFYYHPQMILAFGIPQYVPQPGVYGSLEAKACGLVVNSGGQWFCFPGNLYQKSVSGYVYTDPYGREYDMGLDGRLNAIKDLNGNTLTFNADGIASSVGGMHVSFERDVQGRITRMVDRGGNVYSYSYGAAGDLVDVALPGVADPVRYTYRSGHFFLSAIDPRGNTMALNTYYPDGRLKSVTDAVGNTFQYTYDLSTNTTTVINPDGGVTTSTCDNHGNTLSQTDPLGRTTNYAYDGNHNKLSETNALGHVTRYIYDSDGNQTSVTGPLGKTATTAYNQYGGPTHLTDALGNVTTIGYDANHAPSGIGDDLGKVVNFTFDNHGNTLTRTDANGKTTTYTYDDYGNRLSETDALGHTTTYTYDQLGRVLTKIDPLSNTTRYDYDALGHVLTETNPLGLVTSYEYDANGNRTAQSDPAGRRTSYTYDAANRLTETTYPDSTTLSYAYDWRGNVITRTDQEGYVTRYEYDLASQLISVTFAERTPDSSTICYEYDAVGRLACMIDPRGHVSTYSYDAAGNLLSVTDPLSHTVTYTYDDAGRRISATDPNGRQTRYEYDVRGRLILTTYPDGTTSRQEFDGMGYLLSSTDQAGQTTRYTYDAVGRLLAARDALSQTTMYRYDAVANLLNITDASGHVTSYEYDSLGRRTRRTLPLGMSETYRYDAVGNLISKTDFNGKTTTYTYDAMNRLTEKLSDPGLGEPTVIYAYTPTGRRASMTDTSGTTVYSYDALGRLRTKVTPYGTLTYTYDTAGNLLSMRSSNANGTSVDYAYDALNRVVMVTDNRLAGGTTTYNYDAVGNLREHRYPNGSQTVHTYDELDRLTGLTTSRAGADLASYEYTLGPAGNRLSVTELSGRVVDYNYDVLYRLTNETVTGDPISANNGAIDYTYDAVGNRLSRNSTVDAVPSATYVYDANDRLTSDTYDASGNTVGSDANTYEYDFENHLTQLDSGDVSIIYDGDGNRVSMTIDGVTTNYLVDDRNPTGYAQVVEEIVDEVVQRTYTYGRDRISQNQLINDEWTASFYGYDGQRSVRFLTDISGEVVNTYTYGAFGNLVHSTETVPNVYTYAGEPYDSNLGLIYLRARYMNPTTGRFWTMDSYDGCIYQPLTLHKYAYAHSDPVNNCDPTGMIVCVSNLFFGQVVHKKIADHFRATVPFGISGPAIGTILGVALDPLFPDLVDLMGAVSPPFQYPQVYEIKPVLSIAAGLVQLQGYLTILNTFDPQGRHWVLGHTYVPPSPITITPGVWALVFPPTAGLIVYCPVDLRGLVFLAVALAYHAVTTMPTYRIGQLALQGA